tara:strand:+ start:432 stop:632 length:201 start_codon:yes stop_codon:yes gene_type:complete
MAKTKEELRIAVVELSIEIETYKSTIETQMSMIESLCGENYELKAEINILQNIVRSYIPDLDSGKN